MSNSEENITNPIIKNIVDDVTNEVVGVAYFHDIPERDVIQYNERKLKTEIAESIVDWVLNKATERVSSSSSFIRERDVIQYNERKLKTKIAESIVDWVVNKATERVSSSSSFIRDHKNNGQINFDVIDSFESEREEAVNYYKVPVKNKNLLYAIPPEPFEDWSEDSKLSEKIQEQDLIDFKFFQLKTLGAIYNDSSEDNKYSEETYESEVFPQTDYFQRQNTFSGRSRKNKSASASPYNFNHKENGAMNIDYSKSLSSEANKHSNSVPDMPNTNKNTYYYCECLNMKKHGDGDGSACVDSNSASFVEGTMNLPLDILPPISDNDDNVSEHNKLLKKKSYKVIQPCDEAIDKPFLNEIDRISLCNVQPFLKQKDSNESIEDNSWISVDQKTETYDSLNLPEVVSSLSYDNDKSSEWINKESDTLFKENNSVTEGNSENPFPNFYNMTPSPRFINYLYTSNTSYSDNENVNTNKNKMLDSELERTNQVEENENCSDSCNTTGEIYSFEEDRNQMSSVSLEEASPYLVESDTVIHVNTAEYDESKHSFKRYYEMYTESNQDINTPTKPSLLEMYKLGYTFDDNNKKSTDSLDLPRISPNTLENWEEGQEVEVNSIEPVSPENVNELGKKTLKRQRQTSNDSPQMLRKKVWSSVGLVDKPLTKNILFGGSDDELETEDTTDNILVQRNSSSVFDVPSKEENIICEKSSSHCDIDNVNENIHEQEGSIEVNEYPLSDTIIKDKNSSEDILYTSKSDLHNCFSRSTMSVHNSKVISESSDMVNNNANTIDSNFVYDPTDKSEDLTDSKNSTLSKSPARKGFFAWFINLFRRRKTVSIKEEEGNKLEEQKRGNSLEKRKNKMKQTF